MVVCALAVSGSPAVAACPGEFPLKDTGRFTAFRGTVLQSNSIGEKDTQGYYAPRRADQDTRTEWFGSLFKKERIYVGDALGEYVEHPSGTPTIRIKDESGFRIRKVVEGSGFEIGKSHYVVAFLNRDEKLELLDCTRNLPESRLQEWSDTGNDPHWASLEVCGTYLSRLGSMFDSGLDILDDRACRTDLETILHDENTPDDAAKVIRDKLDMDTCHLRSLIIGPYESICEGQTGDQYRQCMSRFKAKQAEKTRACKLELSRDGSSLQSSERKPPHR